MDLLLLKASPSALIPAQNLVSVETVGKGNDRRIEYAAGVFATCAATPRVVLCTKNGMGQAAMTRTVRVTPAIALAEDEIVETFVRAHGPGGQNVNKLATAVQLRFDVARSPSLPEDVRARLSRLAGRRLTGDGVLIIEAHRFRTQNRNREDARTRLFELIRAASIAPKVRRSTKPTAASRERRLQEKKVRGAVKRGRRNLEE
jgi:ribosome-associated protein